MRIFLKRYSLFSLVTILLMILSITLIVKNINMYTIAPHFASKGLDYVKDIIWHNLQNYLQYLAFPLAPIWILKDDFFISVGFATSIIQLGGQFTFSQVWLHGLVEIPNILLYQFLSIQWLITCLKRKKLVIIPYLKENYHWYLLSLILLVIAAFLEGMF